MSKNKTPSDDGALRATMRTLSKRSLFDLRAAYQRTHGKDPGTMSRDALIKSLLAHAGTQPPASHPTRKEQATAARRPRPSKRKRDERLPAAGGTLRRMYRGKEHVLEVLERGFRMNGKDFKSSTAAALSILPYKAVSGPAWWGYDKPAKTPGVAPETPVPAAPSAPAKRKSGRPISPKRR